MNDDILEILIDRGVPGAVVVRVAKLIRENEVLKAEAEILDRQRAAARDRMQRVRERARTVLNSSEQQLAPIGSKKERKKEESIGRRASRAKPKTPLPDNWHSELAGDVEFERFCDHARAKGRLCADWDAALRNWNRNAPRFNGAQGNGNGRRQGSVLDAADRLREKLKEAGATEDYVPGSSGPEPLRLDNEVRPANLRLIPKG